MARFEEDLVSRQFRGYVRRDFMGGVRSGVNGTPTFIVDGVRYDGILDEQSSEAVLRQRIAQADGRAIGARQAYTSCARQPFGFPGAALSSSAINF